VVSALPLTGGSKTVQQVHPSDRWLWLQPLRAPGRSTRGNSPSSHRTRPVRICHMVPAMAQRPDLKWRRSQAHTCPNTCRAWCSSSTDDAKAALPEFPPCPETAGMFPDLLQGQGLMRVRFRLTRSCKSGPQDGKLLGPTGLRHEASICGPCSNGSRTRSLR
jgi:hypothetical protein